MIQFGAEVLDNLLAPGISSFNAVDIPDVSDRFSEQRHWLSNLFLNSLIGPKYREDWKQASVTFIFRTQNALRAYESARTKTYACVKAFQSGRPASALYFEAVSDWETTLLNVQIALDVFLRFMAPETAETDDAQRIRMVGNRIKHFAEDIEQGKNTGDLTLPMWLYREGLRTRAADVTFEELAENLEGMAKACDTLQNPSAAAPGA